MVDTISVVSGLMEILSHTGTPVELLTDLCAQFLGKVCNKLCLLLNIRHITTTAYHPWSNDALKSGMVTLRVCSWNWRAH